MKERTLYIKSTYANIDSWFDQLVNRVGGRVEGNKLHLEPSSGSGFISITHLQQGLSYLTVDVWLNVDFVYERSFKPGEQQYLILIGLSPGLVLKYGTETYTFDTVDKIKAVIVSPNVSTVMYANSNESLRMLNIVVSKDWIKKNVMEARNKTYIRQILNSTSPLILLEDFDPKHRDMIKSLFNFRFKDKIQKLSAVISTLSFLVNRISDRVLGIEKKLFNDKEEEVLKKVCLELQKRWKTFPTISSLSKMANMGESSFKRKFKLYTGMSPYQYFLKVKLDKAMDLLIRSDMTISEIGYECGYSNLSHFARQFKKEFGVLPKEVQ